MEMEAVFLSSIHKKRIPPWRDYIVGSASGTNKFRFLTPPKSRASSNLGYTFPAHFKNETKVIIFTMVGKDSGLHRSCLAFSFWSEKEFQDQENKVTRGYDFSEIKLAQIYPHIDRSIGKHAVYFLARLEQLNCRVDRSLTWLSGRRRRVREKGSCGLHGKDGLDGLRCWVADTASSWIRVLWFIRAGIMVSDSSTSSAQMLRWRREGEKDFHSCRLPKRRRSAGAYGLVVDSSSVIGWSSLLNCAAH